MANENMKDAKKTIRKQARLKHLLKADGLYLSESATKYLVIGNVGLSTGSSYDLLKTTLEMSEVEQQLLMVPNRQYSIMICESSVDAQKLLEEFQGKDISNMGSHTKMYLAYLENVPETLLKLKSVDFNLPPGLILLDEFITEDYEDALVSFANSDCFLNEKSFLKQRKVKHFGYEFDYETNNVDKNKPLPQGIPDVCQPFISSLLKNGCISSQPDQLTINIYQPGQGIPPHIDTHSAFEEEIVSLSLNSDLTMDFFHPSNQRCATYLRRRSVIIMRQECRYLWSHGIATRKRDVISTLDNQLITKERQTRISYTFRQIRKTPCDCSFPLYCDSQKQYNKNENHESDVALETVYVQQVYEAIADHFNHTRHTPWPRVVEFLFSLKPGSLVLDVGCGNGKYFALNKNIYEIGCDRSLKLSEICQTKNYEVFCADIMNIPIRDGVADACLCIAVIHHLASPKRRANAVRNLVKVLCPGGKALIYVWAMEQDESDYVKERARETDHQKKNSENQDNSSRNMINETPLPCPVHVNRTHFEHQDILVPWHLKKKLQKESDIVHHRYYHIFHRGELEKLCHDIDDVKIVERYYDKGNWCVVLQKLPE